MQGDDYVLGDDDVSADRNYIKEFILERRRTLGQKHGVEYAEAFHYISGSSQKSVMASLNRAGYN